MDKAWTIENVNSLLKYIPLKICFFSRLLYLHVAPHRNLHRLFLKYKIVENSLLVQKKECAQNGTQKYRKFSICIKKLEKCTGSIGKWPINNSQQSEELILVRSYKYI